MSWVDDHLHTCHQVMPTDDRAPLDEWITNWADLVDFGVVPVMTSAEPAAQIGPRL